MASDSHSWIFPIPEADIPASPLDVNDRECSGEIQRLMSAYLGNDGSSESRGGFVEYWVEQNAAALPGLDYVNRRYAVLDCTAIHRALDEFDTAFRLIASVPDTSWHRWRGGMSIADAVNAPDDVVDGQIAGDRENDDPYYLILYLRDHRRVLQRALDTHGYALYLSWNPYAE